MMGLPICSIKYPVQQQMSKRQDLNLSFIILQDLTPFLSTKNSPVGDGLENHHVPQKNIAKDVVLGYPQDKTAGSAPAITLTETEHKLITTAQKANQNARSQMTPRELLADDSCMLRDIGVPNDKIQQIIELNKVKYGFNK